MNTKSIHEIRRKAVELIDNGIHSVNALGRSLGCAGAEKSNMCGRDLVVIRRALGFQLYVKLSAPGSWYRKLFLLIKWDPDLLRKAEQEIFKTGKTTVNRWDITRPQNKPLGIRRNYEQLVVEATRPPDKEITKMIDVTRYYNVVMTDHTTGKSFACHGPYLTVEEQQEALTALQVENGQALLWVTVHNKGELRIGRWMDLQQKESDLQLHFEGPHERT